MEEAKNGDAGNASFMRFKDAVPKNKVEWEGSVVLFDAAAEEFYNIAFGTGDNLGPEDLDEGYDDYIMVDRYGLDGSRGSALVVVDAVDNGCVDEDTDGLRMIDSGQLMLKRKEWTDGDIRRFITEALDFVGYGADKVENPYEYLVYIASGK